MKLVGSLASVTWILFSLLTSLTIEAPKDSACLRAETIERDLKRWVAHELLEKTRVGIQLHESEEEARVEFFSAEGHREFTRLIKKESTCEAQNAAVAIVIASWLSAQQPPPPSPRWKSVFHASLGVGANGFTRSSLAGWLWLETQLGKSGAPFRWRLSLSAPTLRKASLEPGDFSYTHFHLGAGAHYDILTLKRTWTVASLVEAHVSLYRLEGHGFNRNLISWVPNLGATLCLEARWLKKALQPTARFLVRAHPWAPEAVVMGREAKVGLSRMEVLFTFGATWSHYSSGE